ncbi:MAG TPA: DUF1707 domain-containing protein [Gammaproteobacteria bacterium]|nr:DUF1707 domain-containing protein [Gammaproteobacteria bacterium]
MTVAEDKPLESLRSETIDQLVLNYGHGKLSLEAFERRLDRAFDAKSHEALTALTEDLEPIDDAGYAEKKRAELGIPQAAPSGESVEHIINVFSGTHRRGAWAVPQEIRMLNVFGGADLDLSEARFAAQTTRIRMFLLFGGVTFHVPEGTNTISKAICIFGGIDNRGNSAHAPGTPTLVLEGFVLFGGAHVRVRKTFRRRVLEFAEAMRSTFGPAH